MATFDDNGIHTPLRVIPAAFPCLPVHVECVSAPNMNGMLCDMHIQTRSELRRLRHDSETLCMNVHRHTFGSVIFAAIATTLWFCAQLDPRLLTLCMLLFLLSEFLFFRYLVQSELY